MGLMIDVYTIGFMIEKERALVFEPGHGICLGRAGKSGAEAGPIQVLHVLLLAIGMNDEIRSGSAAGQASHRCLYYYLLLRSRSAARFQIQRLDGKNRHSFPSRAMKPKCGATKKMVGQCNNNASMDYR